MAPVSGGHCLEVCMWQSLIAWASLESGEGFLWKRVEGVPDLRWHGLGHEAISRLVTHVIAAVAEHGGFQATALRPPPITQ